jgi:hypothetical protein
MLAAFFKAAGFFSGLQVPPLFKVVRLPPVALHAAPRVVANQARRPRPQPGAHCSCGGHSA